MPLARLLLSSLCLAIGVVHAGQLYRWTDDNGVTHYGDRQPRSAASEVEAIPFRSEPGAIARLRIDRVEGHYQAWAENRLAGPIEVMLHFTRRQNIIAEPALPARATVPAGGSALVAVLAAADPTRGGSFRLRLESLPGHPSAAPRDVEYRLPLQRPDLRIDQGYGGRFSHRDEQNRYAVDFAIPAGTPVLAARGGVVMQAASDFDRSGLDLDEYGGRANFIRILHDDGSMAVYAHLQPDGVLVRVGQRVRAGERIGLSGNTGFSTGPHLHFVVQVNRGMRLLSIPFRMAGVESVEGTSVGGASAPTPSVRQPESQGSGRG